MVKGSTDAFFVIVIEAMSVADAVCNGSAYRRKEKDSDE